MLRFYRLGKGCCMLGIGVPILIVVLVSMISQQREAREEIRRSRAPVSISIEDFIRTPPAKGWYRLAGAVVDVRRAALLTRPVSDDDTSRVSFVMVPMRSRRDTDPKAQSQLALFTSNDDMRTVLSELVRITGTGKSGSKPQDDDADRMTLYVQDLLSATRSGSDPEVRRWLKKNQGRLVQERTITGKVIPIEDLDELQQKLFHFGSQQFASDAVALIEGAQPQADPGSDTVVVILVILIVFGVLAATVYLYLGLRNGS